MFADTGNTLPQVRNGHVRVLGVATRERAQVLPDVPTLAEAGLPDVTSTVWFMLAAPAKTPPAVIAKIHESVTRAVKDPDVIARYAALGIDIVASTPQEMAKTLADETVYWSAIIRATGVKVE
jgi:tripartite-type tricarboxylate transporter receptor subunit TctC